MVVSLLLRTPLLLIAVFQQQTLGVAGQQDMVTAAQAQIMALAAGKDKSMLAPSSNTCKMPGQASQSHSTSTISHNTSAANSLIQQNAQLKALGLVPQNGVSASGATSLDSQSLVASADPSSASSNSAGLLAALAASQQHQQQQLAALAGAVPTGAVPYHALPAGFDLVKLLTSLNIDAIIPDTITRLISVATSSRLTATASTSTATTTAAGRRATVCSGTRSSLGCN